jgi:hypothetical protein
MKPSYVLGRCAGLVSLLSLAAAYVASGCGPSDDRYYCDGSGCYSCDGYGCTTVAPPPAPACTGQASCPAGDVCTEAGCLESCTTADECERGTVCKEGVCAAPTQTPGTKKECSSKSDCGGAGALCVQGTCQTCGGTSGPCPCAANSECASDQVCSAGACVAKSAVCRYASDCGTGESCVDGKCEKPCSDDAACGANAACAKGFCEPKPPPSGACTSDAQCSGATPKCLAGKCAAPCTGDVECGSGQYCNQGACSIDTRPKLLCTATDKSACSASQSCVDGYCKYTCQSDDACRLIDARIGYCGVDHVCRTPAEAKPQCTSQSDCATGQSCVDNTCK